LAFLSYFLATFLADLSAAFRLLAVVCIFDHPSIFFFNASILPAGPPIPFKEAFVLASFASLAACLLALATLRFD
jgi:hypothetical protein